MEFGWSEGQQAYRRSVEEFASQELNDDVVGRDAEARFSPEGWAKCATFGIQGLPVPQAYGGSEVDPVTLALALEALGFGCTDNGLLFSLGAQMWSAAMPIVRFGTEEQKMRYLPGLCDGSLIGVQGMTERESGSDAFSMKTSAAHLGDRYVLDGSKVFVTNAPVADIFVIFASTDRSKGFAGVSAFLVDRETPGLVLSPPLEKMGLRTTPMGELTFSGCQVPEANLLGRVGGGLAVFSHSMEWERAFIMAPAVGTMRRQLERCIAYARERKQFGKSIGSFQAVSHRIVDMKLRLTTAQHLLYSVAWRKSQGQSIAIESALAKLHLSESFIQSSLDAQQIHGGQGYMAAAELERDVRDALAGRIYSGTSDIQRNIIAGRIGL